jgi:hypothetical protein
MMDKSIKKKMSEIINKILWLFVCFPIIVYVVSELNKKTLIGHIRIVDFLDLILIAPFYLATFIFIHNRIFDNDQSKITKTISLVLISVFMYGHSMHLTANAINTYSTEIMNYKSILPLDTYSLIYFFDETLGHIIIYSSLFLLFSLWALKSSFYGKSLNPLLSGAIWGFSLSISLIESSHPYLSIFGFLVMILSTIYNAKTNNKSWIMLIKTHVFSRFIFTASITMLFGEIIYLIIFGQFIQPSMLY